MATMRGFVMSLARRPERLAAFQEYWAHTGLDQCLDVEPFVAFDGAQLDLEAVKPRISPRNVSMPETRLRSIAGCALSHLELWRRIAAQQEPMMVFEDDARLAAGVNVDMLASALRRLPSDADLVWLNDYSYGARASLRYRLHLKLLGRPPARVTFSAMPDVLTTTEAYVITPSYAARLVEAIAHDLGAVDRHMQIWNGKIRGRVYQANPPLFGQADRKDSDTGASSS